ncbi:membrane protein involved in the export of O-antigen and teichoic acid [Beggiatoa alba B18LD]|uniref:Membrane protein involved in the export of O-antigen and teichoic acid n=1 Tax=Beggiatoa alba B18LD TaxID=395493 RepID=I3CHN5_9GAMM|nr:oligosaccharide flippase family protein [Beggiatoa alba]EIJ43128.1 membrane protein involved in the export of O-antigen and teichoic acid [Beggiatoa alba B18LD]
MTSLKLNIIANYVGNAWATLMSLAFIPIYIHFLGIEAYGLIGFFTTLTAMFALLDMGLSATLNREIAKLSIQTESAQKTRDLVLTITTIYWLIGIAIGCIIILLASFISTHWLKSVSLNTQTIEHAIIMMGLIVVFHWVQGIYTGGIVGLQKLVFLNGVMITTATLRGFGAVLVLWLISPTLQAFFTWQLIVSIIHTALLAIGLWRYLPSFPQPARFQLYLFRDIWRFMVGMNAITLVSLVLTQLDKVILSKLLTLEMFGYYSLASMVAGSLFRAITPISSAIFPRFSQLVAMNAEEELKRLYHHSSQLIAVVIFPLAVGIAFFSYDILLLWTQNVETAEQTYLLVSLLILGNMSNGIMHVPYALQLAYGWTSFAFYVNVIAIVILVPLLFLLASLYGAIGAAITWLLLNSSYVLVGIHFMHRRLLPTEKWQWYIADVFVPLFVVSVIAGIYKWLLIINNHGTVVQLIMLTSIFVSLFIGVLLSTPQMREVCFRFLSRIKTYKFLPI